MKITIFRDELSQLSLREMNISNNNNKTTVYVYIIVLHQRSLT